MFPTSMLYLHLMKDRADNIVKQLEALYPDAKVAGGFVDFGIVVSDNPPRANEIYTQLQKAFSPHSSSIQMRRELTGRKQFEEDKKKEGKLSPEEKAMKSTDIPLRMDCIAISCNSERTLPLQEYTTRVDILAEALASLAPQSVLASTAKKAETPAASAAKKR